MVLRARTRKGFQVRSLFLAGALVAASPGRAAADSVTGTRSELLVERSHEIALLVDRGHAELVVRRSVFNGGPRHDQAEFFIDVPLGAVAVGLKTLGSRAGRPHWFGGELLEAEAAAARYRELTGIGGYYPKDPALLSWRSPGLLALQVFPCPPGQMKSVEYTLVIPTSYRGGAYHLELPALGTAELAARVVPKPARARDTLALDGAPAPRALRVVPVESADLALVPHAPPALDGELATVEFAPGRVLTRLAARAAPRLSELPKAARVVIALDASLSTPSDFVERAKLALDAYLSHLGDASVELFTFDRQVSHRFGRFLPVADARRELKTLEVKRRNGSEVDLALYEADQLLAGREGGARRIVLVTDGLARSGLTPERLRAATTASGATTHVGLLGVGSAALSRDDDHPWARGLKPNRGLVWRATVAERDSPSERERVFEEWARPLRLHGFHARSSEPELAELLLQVPPVLDEGEGFETLELASKRAPWLVFEGELWTEPVRASFESAPEREKLWSALVFGTHLVDALSEEEMMTLAVRGGAVSPVTSYLAIEPGVRPSTEGLDWQGGGAGFGAGRPSVRMGSTRVSGRVPPIDRDAFLETRLSADLRRCGGRPGSASIGFETTAAEIAHVLYVDVEAGGPLVVRCLVEAVWDLILPVQFDEEWNSWSVNV